MENNEKKSRDMLRIIEIILLVIVIILVIFLIILELMHNEYSKYKREYDFDAYTVANDENSITVTLHHKDGSRIKTEEIVYFENGELVKTVNKYYYEKINIAKDEYNATMEMLSENSGTNNNYYTVAKEENAIVYTYENPSEIYADSYNSLRSRKITNKNEDVIDFVMENIDERFKDTYVKVK